MCSMQLTCIGYPGDVCASTVQPHATQDESRFRAERCQIMPLSAVEHDGAETSDNIGICGKMLCGNTEFNSHTIFGQVSTRNIDLGMSRQAPLISYHS